MINPVHIYEPCIAVAEVVIAIVAMMLLFAPLLKQKEVEQSHNKLTAVRNLFRPVLFTGLTTHETNPYQCSPERRNPGCYGRWPATLRSGHRNTFSGTEKGQCL
jgi:hypothetical protein